MRQSVIYSILSIACLLAGCSRTSAEIQESGSQSPVLVQFVSSVKPEECYVCGNCENSLVSYYAKRDSVGIIYWNKPSVSDTEVRVYEDNGNEIFKQEHTSMKVRTFGEENGSIAVCGTPERGFSNVTIKYTEKDKINFENVSTLLCQDCLNKVVHFYTDQKNCGGDRAATTGYCLIDFTTRQLYTLSDPYRGYYIRDYYVTFDICEGEESYIELFIFYAPERHGY